MPMLRSQNRPLTRKIKNVCPSWPSWPSYPKTPTKPPIFQPVQDGQQQIPWPPCPSPSSRSAYLCVPCGEHPAAAAAVTPAPRLAQRLSPVSSPKKKLVDLADLDNLTPKPNAAPRVPSCPESLPISIGMVNNHRRLICVICAICGSPRRHFVSSRLRV